MLGFPSEAEVKRIREKYPVGTILNINYVNDEWYAQYQGMNCEVKYVDDIGQLHCRTVEGNYGLTLIIGEDSFRKVD